MIQIDIFNRAHSIETFFEAKNEKFVKRYFFLLIWINVHTM